MPNVLALTAMETHIRELAAADYPDFFAYLNAQLAINGKEGYPLFQPVSRDVVEFPSEKESAFVAGLSRSIGQPGWRRAWVICNAAGDIMGHVDLRAHADSVILHRALLGMGVGKAFRRRGLSRQLLDYVCQWVRDSDGIEWIDIEVLGGNTPALALYQGAGFEHLCEIQDMYRIDGQPQSVIRMAARFR